MATRIPQNQLDALPILTESAVGAPDEVITVGKSVSRKWNPTSTGINTAATNVADPRSGANSYLLSNLLDFTGMRTFTAALGAKVLAAGGDLANAWTIYLVPQCFTIDGEVQLVPSAPPSTNNMTGNYGTAAFAPVGTLTMNVLGVGAFPAYRMASCSWSIGGASTAPHRGAGALGPCRLWLANPTSTPSQTVSLTVWASNG